MRYHLYGGKPLKPQTVKAIHRVHELLNNEYKTSFVVKGTTLTIKVELNDGDAEQIIAYLRLLRRVNDDQAGGD